MKRALIAFAATVMLAGPALADQALATSKNCMACHAADKKLVGPSYKDVAAKYAGQKDAVDKLAVKIQKGGVRLAALRRARAVRGAGHGA